MVQCVVHATAFILNKEKLCGDMTVHRGFNVFPGNVFLKAL